MAIPLQVFGDPASRACLQIRFLDGAPQKGSNQKLQKIMRGQILREHRYLVDNFGEMKKIILKGRDENSPRQAVVFSQACLTFRRRRVLILCRTYADDLTN